MSGCLLLGVFFVAALLKQSHSEVLWRVADEVELGEHQLDLLDEFTGARRLPELHSLDESRFKLVAEDVRGLNLEDVVTKGDQVRDSLRLHVSARLQKSLHLPLLVVTRVQFLVFSACRDDCHVALQCFVHFRQEPVR